MPPIERCRREPGICLETRLKPSWENFGDWPGDLGRDLALQMARRFARSSLAEHGVLVPVTNAAFARAVSKAAIRIAKNRQAPVPLSRHPKNLQTKDVTLLFTFSALIKNGLTFQAFHQHVPMHPQVWFVHFRGVGDPLALAKAVRATLTATGTPLPQAPPSNPTTPLDANRLAAILHGTASVGDEGVVTVWVYRRDRVTIDDVRVNPQANISMNIEFRPS